MGTVKRESENKSSMLLSKEENDRVFALLGRKCNTLATGVVQVVMTSPPAHQEWQKRHFGIACFVKDSQRRSYFIRVLDIVRQDVVWEQEIYSQFTYSKLRPYLHSFEADDCMAGLNFASETEAELFNKAVQDKLRHRQQKKQEKRRNQGGGPQLAPTQSGVSVSKKQNVSTVTQSTTNTYKKQTKKNKKNGDSKHKISKADIGMPTDFKHVQHVGFKSSTGFDLQLPDEVDSDLMEFFKVVGISDKELKDEETRNFIYEFIDQHGGIDSVKQETANRRAPPPVPARELPPTPKTAARGIAPPPPPARTTPIASPSRNHVAPPPPPPPIRNNSGFPPPKSAAPLPPPPPPPPPQVVVSMPGGAGGPPPPPPPPPPMMMDIPKAPPPPPMAFDPRNALLAQIREGKPLQQVEHVALEPKTESSDGRGALLQQIRKGVELKNVVEVKTSSPAATPQLGLAGMLKRAMDDRARAMQPSDSESDDDDEERCDDDDEWDD